MFNDTPARKTDRLLGVRKRKTHEMVISFIIVKYYKTQCKELCNNKISQLGLFKIYSKIQFVLKTTQLVWGGI